MLQSLASNFDCMEEREDMDIVLFLHGLEPKYEPARAQILSSSKLPFFHQKSFLGGNSTSPSTSSARGSRGSRGGRESRGGGQSGGQESRKYAHCGHHNHPVDYYGAHHGKPSGTAN